MTSPCRSGVPAVRGEGCDRGRRRPRYWLVFRHRTILSGMRGVGIGPKPLEATLRPDIPPPPRGYGLPCRLSRGSNSEVLPQTSHYAVQGPAPHSSCSLESLGVPDLTWGPAPLP